MKDPSIVTENINILDSSEAMISGFFFRVIDFVYLKTRTVSFATAQYLLLPRSLLVPLRFCSPEHLDFSRDQREH